MEKEVKKIATVASAAEVNRMKIERIHTLTIEDLADCASDMIALKFIFLMKNSGKKELQSYHDVGNMLKSFAIQLVGHDSDD